MSVEAQADPGGARSRSSPRDVGDRGAPARGELLFRMFSTDVTGRESRNTPLRNDARDVSRGGRHHMDNGIRISRGREPTSRGVSTSIPPIFQATRAGR